MSRLGGILAVVLLAVSSAALGDCIPNGHFTVVGTTDPMTGTAYPYTEDLVHQPYFEPIGAPMTIAYHDDLRWTKIQTGCSSYGERNVSASQPVNLMLRASLRVNYDRQATTPAKTRFEVQLRLGATADDPNARVVLTETRRLGGKYPQSFRFGASVQDLPAGNYVYSFWLRILDGPETNRVNIGLQWITAQGAPNAFPSRRAVKAGDDFVGDEKWAAIGEPLFFDNAVSLDLSLQSSFVVSDAPRGAVIMFGYGIDGESAGKRFGSIAAPSILPSGATIFDHRIAVPTGRHTLRLYAKTRKGAVRLSRVAVDFVSYPTRSRGPEIAPMQEAIETEPVAVTTAGSAEQPVAMSPVCGNWTKILEFQTRPSQENDPPPSWTLSGYVEFLGGSGYGQIAVQAVRRELSTRENAEVEVKTDMGMYEFQIGPGRDGVYFYGDCSKWGNSETGNRISIWVRRIEGCNDAPFGGGFVVGKRWLAIKHLPSAGPHL